MLVTKWKNEKLLISHVEKHILEKDNRNEEERKEKFKWEQEFPIIKKYIIENNKESLKNEYRDISIQNTDGNHYLYRDTISNDFSINFFNYYGNVDSELTTCTKVNNKELLIHSCFFKDNRVNNLDIFLFVNNMKIANDNIYSYKAISENCKIFRRDDILEESCILACSKSDLENPLKSTYEKLLTLKINMIIEYFKLIKQKQDKIKKKHQQKDNRILKVDLIYQLLTKALIFCLNNDKKTILKEEIEQVLYEKDNMTILMNSKIYKEDKDYFDLYVEMLNLCLYYINKVTNENYDYINFIDSRWHEMFEQFKNLSCMYSVRMDKK